MSKGKSLLRGAVPAEGVHEEVRAEVEASKSVLSDFQIRFQRISDKIMEISEDIPDDELEQESALVMDTATDITRMLSQLSALLNRIAREQQARKYESSSPGPLAALQKKIDMLVELETLRTTATNTSVLDDSEAASARHSNSIRLPKIEFDKFSGDVLRFQEFWDSFNVAVNSNSFLQPVEKLSYLRAYLSGDAKEVISGLSNCDANYEVAIQLIQKRFGNPEASVDAHYGHLMNLAPVSNDTTRLRCFFDEVEKHLRCLSALGEDIEHRHFISLIMSKLPRQVIVRLEESKSDEESWTVELVRRKLHSQLAARECADRKQSSTASRPSNQSQAESSEHRSPFKRNSSYSTRWHERTRPGGTTTESLVAGEQKEEVGFVIKCILCNGDHHSDQCRRFKSAEERKSRIKGRCYICLKKDHLASHCSCTKPCFHCKQVKRHHRCLCPKMFPSSPEASAVTLEDEDSDYLANNDAEPPQHAALASGEKVFLQTATVEVKNVLNGCVTSTRVLLDSGSNRSYISRSLAEKIGAKVSGTESFSVVTFGAEKPKSVETSVTQINLILRNGASKQMDVSIVKKITGNIHRAPLDFKSSSFLWKNLPLADTLPAENESSPVDFLIGNDYYLDLITAEKIQVGPGLYLLGSQLGWVLSGRFETRISNEPSVSLFVTSYMNQSVPQVSLYSSVDECLPLTPSFEDYWRLEAIGIKDDPEVKDDDKALAKFNSTAKFAGGRYQVTWPWKDTSAELPENYDLAFGRFKSLLRKFQKDQALLNKYSAVIKEQEEKGIIEKIGPDSEEGMCRHYIPHHPVINLNKTTTKVRIVYDASAKCRKMSQSLNECLLRGPVILEDLCGLLLRFRLSAVAIVADIEKAFLQIGLQVSDRDVTRFFWLKDRTNLSTEKNLQLYRFCRVPFGVISSPFLLGATIRFHLAQEKSTTAKQITENLYVNNVITGVNAFNDAKRFYTEGKAIFSKASMNLREWASNSKEFMVSVSGSDKACGPNIKVLGLNWNIDEDSLNIVPEQSREFQASSTKRQVFKALTSVFDPLGFFTPLTLKAKLFIHQLWADKLHWDEPIGESHQSEWNYILFELSKIPTMKIPRFVGLNDNNHKDVQLLCFCDASAQAYATVVYLKVTGSTKTTVCYHVVKLNI